MLGSLWGVLNREIGIVKPRECSEDTRLLAQSLMAVCERLDSLIYELQQQHRTKGDSPSNKNRRKTA